VNSIHPGLIYTPMVRRGTAEPGSIAAGCGYVAVAVLFLARDDASFVTGAELAVDGAIRQCDYLIESSIKIVSV
jgi:NAD(P)-dependent dehydrogenase (short-subunit alcohol dehydrogenase family)